jgi:hypothetical protein
VTTPYLLRVPARQMNRLVCAYCGDGLNEDRDGTANFRTRDHILTRLGPFIRRMEHIGGPDVTNIRPCCFSCNQLRAELGHCCGALAIAILHGIHTGQPKKRAAKALGMLQPKKRRRFTAAERRRMRSHRLAVRANQPLPTLAAVWPA